MTKKKSAVAPPSTVRAPIQVPTSAPTSAIADRLKLSRNTNDTLSLEFLVGDRIVLSFYDVDVARGSHAILELKKS